MSHPRQQDRREDNLKTMYSFKPSGTGTSQASPSYSGDEQERVREKLIREDRRRILHKRIALIAVCLITILGFATYLFMTKVYLPQARRKADFRKLTTKDVKIGDVVTFGESEWDNTWTVADIQGSKLQLVNVGGIVFSYNEGFDYGSPRAVDYWLSNDYYEAAFGEEEKALIQGDWNDRITHDRKTAESYMIGVVRKRVYPSLWIDVGEKAL